MRLLGEVWYWLVARIYDGARIAWSEISMVS